MKKRKLFLDSFRPMLNKHKNELPNKMKLDAVFETESWFTARQYSTESIVNNTTYKCKFEKEYIKCKQVKMHLSEYQKDVINHWLTLYTTMYNETLKYMRTNYNMFKNIIVRKEILKIEKNHTNFYNIRNKMKEIRDNIIKNSQLSNYKQNTKINTHTLDYAIKQLLTNIKSAETNLIRGHIKNFRMKFWKNTRSSKTIDIEKSLIRNNVLCPKILGVIKYTYNNKKYILNDINSNVKINYNRIKDEYTLLIPEYFKPVNFNDLENKKNIVVLDPGLRTFMTGLSNDGAIKIGMNVNKIIASKLKRLKKIKDNINIPSKIKKKNEILINRKISNYIDELQWQTISFLTKNYKNILLGDMSAKSIVKKNKSVLSPLSKVACLRTRYYEFQQRLKYKCDTRMCNYRLVNERYTSKTCSNCGNYNDKLKGEKKYVCKKCNFDIDRDINACRNIYVNSLLFNNTQ